MGELDDSFARLLGRQATDKERQAIYRARDALNLKATDSVWMLLMALQHYETLYEKIPARIAEAVDAVTKAARMTAEAQAKAAQEETKKTLMGCGRASGRCIEEGRSAGRAGETSRPDGGRNRCRGGRPLGPGVQCGASARRSSGERRSETAVRIHGGGDVVGQQRRGTGRSSTGGR